MHCNAAKYRRRSIRLPGYDYNQPGCYFVTINTFETKLLFGDVVDGVMTLNAWGKIAHDCWTAIPDHFVNTELDAFVVMPNHVHGIVVIVDDGRGTACRAPTVEQFGQPVAGSLPTITRSFKSACTKRINAARQTPSAPVWQRNYFEHIIRNESSLHRIRRYIADNPAHWQEDRHCRQQRSYTP